MRQLFERPMDALAKRFPQFCVAFMSMLWGGVLVLPFQTFSTSGGYSLLEAFAPERMVGLIVLLLGAVNLHALITEHWWLHRKSAIGLMLFWTLTTLLFFTSSPASASWVLLAGLAFLHGWSAVVGPHSILCYEDHEG